MDKEATGADRLQALLAPGHPVRRILEMLDLGLADSEATKFGQLVIVRLVVEIGVKNPLVGLRFVRLVGNDDRRGIAGKEQVFRIGDRLALGTGAGEGDSVAYFDCSFASRSSRAARPRCA